MEWIVFGHSFGTAKKQGRDPGIVSFICDAIFIVGPKRTGSRWSLFPACFSDVLYVYAERNMVIRQQQIEAFATALRDDYVRRMALMVSRDFTCFKAHVLPELEELVRQAISDAKSYGVTLESDTTLYIRLQAILGVRFDINPRFDWVSQVLQNGNLDGTEKMNRIHDHLIFPRSSNV